VVRSLASAVLSVVLCATFLWGGCVSCEQYFMFPGKRLGCCNKSGQCERPGKNSPKPEKRDCNRLPFDRGSSGHTVPLPAVLPATMPTDLARLMSPPSPSPLSFALLLDPSPPDQQAISSVFLI
jgi:hypothetical protein